MSFRRILVPVDFSKGSGTALAYALGFARRIECDVTVLNVVDAPNYVYSEYEFGAPHIREWEKALLDDARRELKKSVPSEPLAKGKEFSFRARSGDAASEIVRESIEGKCDLIILATHGRSGLRHAILGSVAERVIRTATCPVISLKGRAPTAGQSGSWFDMAAGSGQVLHLSRILVPTDLSDLSLVALDPAATLAGCFHAKLDLVHAVDAMESVPALWGELAGATREDYFAHADQRAVAKMRQVIQTRLPGAAWASYEIVHGPPVDKIVELAARSESSLIAMTTRGRSGLEHVFLGSVAEKIVRLAPCPVMTVSMAARK